LATLLLSAGTPMLTAGDELGRTQRGNNNAYAQDNPISWVSWDLEDAARDLLDTTRFLIALRAEHPALRADSFFLGSPRPGEDQTDLLWFAADGAPMDREAWETPGRRVLQMLRPGPDDGDAAVLLVFNGGLDDAEVTLPAAPGDGAWERVWSSAWDRPEAPDDEAEDAVLESLSVEVFLGR
ncbi:MAG TPA: glycogen debranching enzyme GlgX, partial [Isoptericola sp.]|nr:glycogen debranching enzyme GlgX [Isoptericola sp.]